MEQPETCLWILGTERRALYRSINNERNRILICVRSIEREPLLRLTLSSRVTYWQRWRMLWVSCGPMMTIPRICVEYMDSAMQRFWRVKGPGVAGRMRVIEGDRDNLDCAPHRSRNYRRRMDQMTPTNGLGVELVIKLRIYGSCVRSPGTMTSTERLSAFLTEDVRPRIHQETIRPSFQCQMTPRKRLSLQDRIDLWDVSTISSERER